MMDQAAARRDARARALVNVLAREMTVPTTRAKLDDLVQAYVTEAKLRGISSHQQMLGLVSALAALCKHHHAGSEVAEEAAILILRGVGAAHRSEV